MAKAKKKNLAQCVALDICQTFVLTEGKTPIEAVTAFIARGYTLGEGTIYNLETSLDAWYDVETPVKEEPTPDNVINLKEWVMLNGHKLSEARWKHAERFDKVA